MCLRQRRTLDRHCGSETRSRLDQASFAGEVRLTHRLLWAELAVPVVDPDEHRTGRRGGDEIEIAVVVDVAFDSAVTLASSCVVAAESDRWTVIDDPWTLC
jgi:hypothetical protein